MTLIRLDPFRWPYSVQQLRLDEPSRSISVSPRAEELAHYGVFRFEEVVALVEPPLVNPATHRLEQRPPVEIDGVLTQQWEVIELTPEEQEAVYRANNPPRWIEFWAALPDEVDELLEAAGAVKRRLEHGLSVGLGKAADGDSRVFLSAWQQAKTLGLIQPELVAGVQSLATEYDLPAQFVQGLGDLSTETEEDE
jgi:hypothetical protein